MRLTTRERKLQILIANGLNNLEGQAQVDYFEVLINKEGWNSALKEVISKIEDCNNQEGMSIPQILEGLERLRK